MKYLRFLALVGIGLTAGCDDPPPEISHVGRTPEMTLEDLWKLQDPRGIPVEIHGAPFRYVADRDLVEALLPPTGADIEFYVTPVGTWEGRAHPWRIVLHFNPQGAPNPFEDCKRTEEVRTNQPPETGYTVNLAFCNTTEWKAHGFLTVIESEDGDLEAVGTQIQTLLNAIFQVEEPS